MVVGTVTFSAIRSNSHSGVCSRYAVHSRYAVRSRYAVCSRYSKYAVCSRYAVCIGMQYAVGVSAKRSTHTVDLSNMGGGDCYL